MDSNVVATRPKSAPLVGAGPALAVPH